MGKKEHLGEFEQLALLAVLRLGNGAYGAAIQEELDRTADRSSAISSIYITLTRLESKGMVRSELESPGAGPDRAGGVGGDGAGASEGGADGGGTRGGKPRRYFRVEPAGIDALKESRDRLLNMWDGVEQDLETA